MDEPMKLSDKERRFIDAYVGPAHFNGADAARRAGYSEKTAKQIAHEMLTKPYLRVRIDAILESESLSATEILHELRTTALAPTTHFMQVAVPEMTDDEGNVIAPMIVRQDYGAKMKALELLGKNKKIFSEKMELSGNFTFADLARMVAQEEQGEDGAE